MAHQDPSTTAARADLARLLAACYYEPGPEFAEERVFDAMREAAATIDPALTDVAERIGRQSCKVCARHERKRSGVFHEHR